MSCNSIGSELCAYHFGVISDDVRRDVEAHLLGCSACLRAFIEVKRAIETGEDGPLPAPSARSRLRRAVARELSLADPQRPWAWWERPAAFAFAGSAVVAAMIAMRVLTSAPGAPPHALSSGHEPPGSTEPQR